MRGRAFLVCSSVFMLGTSFRRLASLRSMSIELKFSVANLGVACRFFAHLIRRRLRFAGLAADRAAACSCSI